LQAWAVPAHSIGHSTGTLRYVLALAELDKYVHAETVVKPHTNATNRAIQVVKHKKSKRDMDANTGRTSAR